MKWRIGCCVVVVVFLASVGFSTVASAQYAAAVVSYDAGTTPANDLWGTGLDFDIAAAALGSPERFTGEGGAYPSAVSAFSAPYLRDEIVSIGESGHLTLRLSNYVLPQDGPEIGVFANVGLVDTSWPNGNAGSPAGAIGVDRALVEVSGDGLSWTSLNSGDAMRFDIPTNGYTDLTNPYASTPGNVLSDFHQPFTGSLSSFDGLRYRDATATDILGVLAGSGGGTWIDISGTGLAQVGYLRFSVPDDGDSQIGQNFELDAVSVATSAVGDVTVPEPTTGLLVMTFIVVGFSGRSKTAVQAVGLDRFAVG